MLRSIIASACTSALGMALLFAVPGYSQSSSNKSDKSNPSPQANKTDTQKTDTQKPSVHQKMDSSRDAVRALRLTAEARQSIIDKDQPSAKKDVDQALGLLNKVQQNTSAAANGNTNVIPIYAELEQTSFLAPVLSAKNQNKGQQQQGSASNSGQNSNSGQGSTGSQSSQASALPQSDQPQNNSPDVVKWVEGGYSFIGLDVNAAREHLQAAQQALKNNDSGKADLELARAQEAVDTGTIETNMPLVRARENLSLARSELNGGKTTQARAELNAAAKALNDYAKDVHAPHAQAAKDLSSQIKSGASSMQCNKTAATQKIDRWWNQLSDWTGQKTS
jgi:hypothetical protein